MPGIGIFPIPDLLCCTDCGGVIIPMDHNIMSTKKAVKECSHMKTLLKLEVAYLLVCELVFSGVRFERSLTNLRLMVLV